MSVNLENLNYSFSLLCIIILKMMQGGETEKCCEGKMQNFFTEFDITDAIGRLESDKMTFPHLVIGVGGGSRGRGEDLSLTEKGKKWCVDNKEHLKVVAEEYR